MDEAETHDIRLRDLDAGAFRTGRSMAEHGEQPGVGYDQEAAAFGHIGLLADGVGGPGDRTITQRLAVIERVLLALARAQDIAPDALA